MRETSLKAETNAILDQETNLKNITAEERRGNEIQK